MVLDFFSIVEVDSSNGVKQVQLVNNLIGYRQWLIEREVAKLEGTRGFNIILRESYSDLRFMLNPAIPTTVNPKTGNLLRAIDAIHNYAINEAVYVEVDLFILVHNLNAAYHYYIEEEQKVLAKEASNLINAFTEKIQSGFEFTKLEALQASLDKLLSEVSEETQGKIKRLLLLLGDISRLREETIEVKINSRNPLDGVSSMNLIIQEISGRAKEIIRDFEDSDIRIYDGINGLIENFKIETNANILQLQQIPEFTGEYFPPKLNPLNIPIAVEINIPSF